MIEVGKAYIWNMKDGQISELLIGNLILKISETKHIEDLEQLLTEVPQKKETKKQVKKVFDNEKSILLKTHDKIGKKIGSVFGVPINENILFDIKRTDAVKDFNKMKQIIRLYKPHIAKATLKKYTSCYNCYITSGFLDKPKASKQRTHQKASDKALGPVVYRTKNFCIRENPLKDILNLRSTTKTAIKRVLKNYYKGNSRSMERVLKRYKDYVDTHMKE